MTLPTNAPAPTLPVILTNFFMKSNIAHLCYIFDLSQRGALKSSDLRAENIPIEPGQVMLPRNEKQ